MQKKNLKNLKGKSLTAGNNPPSRDCGRGSYADENLSYKHIFEYCKVGNHGYRGRRGGRYARICGKLRVL